MNLKIPKNDKYQWTQHAQYKMRQYGLSPQRVTRVIRNPQRTEEGIVEKTIAVMQPASVRHGRTSAGKPAKIWSQEIWVMYQLKNQNAKIKMQNDNVKFKNILNTKYKIQNTKLRIISAWRYPGVSSKKDPIPGEILDEIQAIL